MHDPDEEPQLYNPAQALLQGIQAHADDAEYHYTTSLVNHFTLSMEMMLSIDPQQALRVSEAFFEYKNNRLTPEQYSNVICDAAFQLKQAYQAMTGEIRRS